jgi:hypothetical protein
MTAASPALPVVSGHGPGGRPVTVDVPGAGSRHVLVARGRPQRHGRTAGHAPSRPCLLAPAARRHLDRARARRNSADDHRGRDDMNRRLASSAGSLDPRACGAVVTPLGEIAFFGRAVCMTLLVVAQILYRFPAGRERRRGACAVPGHPRLLPCTARSAFRRRAGAVFRPRLRGRPPGVSGSPRRTADVRCRSASDGGAGPGSVTGVLRLSGLGGRGTGSAGWRSSAAGAFLHHAGR